MANGDPNSLAAQIVAAYVSHNHVSAHEVVELLRALRAEFSGEAPSSDEAAASTMLAVRVPAVAVDRSILADAIVCLECGAPVKLLKSHIRYRHNLLPQQYCERWGLPADYPFVAHELSSKRRNVALDSGLGKTPHVRHPERQLQRSGPVAAGSSPRVRSITG